MPRQKRNRVPVEGHHHARLRAAEQGLECEVEKPSYRAVSEERHRVDCNGCNHVRLFSNVAKCTNVRHSIRDARQSDRDSHARPRARGQERHHIGSIQRLQQTEKPIRRRRGEQAAALCGQEIVGAKGERLKQISADKNSERGELQNRRDVEEVPPRQKQGPKTLESHQKTSDEHARGDHGDPVRDQELEPGAEAAGRGNDYVVQRDRGLAGETCPNVIHDPRDFGADTLYVMTVPP